MTAFFGYKSLLPEWTYEMFLEHILPEDRAEVDRLFQQAITTQTDWSFECRIRRVDGEVRWISAIGGHQYDEAGQARRMAGIVQDITERKQAEDSLREIQSILSMAENVAQIGSWKWDLRTQKVTWSDEMFRLFEVEREGFDGDVNRVIAERIHPDDMAAVQESNRSTLEETNPIPLSYRIVLPNGTERTVWAQGKLLQDENGEPVALTGYVQDITERKRSEEKVHLQLRRLSALSEIDRAISSSLDMRLSLDLVLSEVLAQLKVDAAAILLFNESTLMLEYFVGKGFHSLAIRKSRMRIGEGLAGEIGFERKLLHIPDLSRSSSQIARKDLIQSEGFVEYFGVPLVAKGMLKGVLEVFQRSPLSPELEWLNYLETLGGQAAIAIDNAQLFEKMQTSNLELIAAYDATIAGWSHAMDLRDKETEGHSQRVTEMTLKLAERMKISDQEWIHIRRGALLHDIGKLGVPDQILLKPGELTKQEWDQMRQHPNYALQMLMPITYLRPALDIPYCHHEKWDGSGYPRGLRGEQIPLAARIFAIVDVWDALTSDRPYRPAWDKIKALQYIQEQSGHHFDPKVVETFLSEIVARKF